jgi:hypothetical protein
MNLSPNGKYLGVLLILFIVCAILLTPLSGLETRPTTDLTILGLLTLSVFLVGLAVSVASFFLLFRRARLASILSIIGSAAFLPAFVVDQTANLSSRPAPVAIFYVEWVTAVIAIFTILVSSRVRKEEPRST